MDPLETKVRKEKSDMMDHLDLKVEWGQWGLLAQLAQRVNEVVLDPPDRVEEMDYPDKEGYLAPLVQLDLQVKTEIKEKLALQERKVLKEQRAMVVQWVAPDHKDCEVSRVQ